MSVDICIETADGKWDGPFTVNCVDDGNLKGLKVAIVTEQGDILISQRLRFTEFQVPSVAETAQENTKSKSLLGNIKRRILRMPI